MHLPKPKGMQVTDLSTLVADHVRRRAHRINGCADQLTLLSLFRLRTLRTTSDQAQAWLIRHRSFGSSLARLLTIARQRPPGTLEVTAVGHQFWWEFRYPTLGVVTANELHVPIQRSRAPLSFVCSQRTQIIASGARRQNAA